MPGPPMPGAPIPGIAGMAAGSASGHPRGAGLRPLKIVPPLLLPALTASRPISRALMRLTAAVLGPVVASLVFLMTRNRAS